MTTTSQLRTRRNAIEQRLAELAADRNVKIIAVTKTLPASTIAVAMDAGFTDVGENYAQEAASKHDELTQQPQWHFIGQLQRNKVKLLAPFVDVWHTVDNVALAREIAKRSPQADVLIQVNLTDDVNRGGCPWGELDKVIDSSREEGLNVLGLTGVAPEGSLDVARFSFRELAQAAQERGLKELSMGMSADFEVAVEEGATMIRLGSTLFGARPLPGAEPR